MSYSAKNYTYLEKAPCIVGLGRAPDNGTPPNHGTIAAHHGMVLSSCKGPSTSRYEVEAIQLRSDAIRDRKISNMNEQVTRTPISSAWLHQILSFSSHLKWLWWGCGVV